MAELTEVLIAGAGPAGLLLAAELRLAGVATVVLERHERRPGYCRGFNLNARALDLLARRGLAAPMLAEGRPVPHAAFSGLPVTLGLAGTSTGHPYTLGIAQTRVEEILEAHAVDRGADLRRGHELRAFRQDGEGVLATVGPAGYQIRALYLVGCDGGRSTVRKLAGIAFPGTGTTRWTLLGDVELADGEALPGVLVIPRPGYVRVITADPSHGCAPVTLETFTAAVSAAAGREVSFSGVRWLTRFGDAARLAERYVQGRVLLAGDAAHIHPPAGAIGVNVALDDAFNLGWKLAATVRGTAPPGLLDTYHEERHRAGERILANTRAQVLLGSADERVAPLVDLFARVAAHPAGNRALAETITGLDTRYTEGDHPWLGRLAPDLALTTPAGPTTLATLLHGGRAVLLDFTGAAAPWSSVVDVVPAACPGHPELAAVLVRPDGHTAWLSTGGVDGLDEALARWCYIAR